MARSTNPFTFDGFDATTQLLRGPVKPKKAPSERRGGSNASDRAVTDFLKRAASVSRKAPEAMVRITGGAKGRDHVKEHLAYITRNGKLEATNERGETITGRQAVKDVAGEWAIGTPQRGPDTRNLMLSMPKGTDPEKVLRAAKTFADKTFTGERQFLLALHVDKDHPHVHLTLKRRGFDGKNLNPRKADLQQWREDFAHELRELGVAAEATPRRARGVVKKPKGIAVFHMEQAHKDGKKTKDGKSRAPAVQLAKYAEAVREITGQAAPKVRPWELKIAERQHGIRQGWLAVAGTLDKHPAPEAKALAKDIRQFVAEMPPIQTERQGILAQVRQGLEQSRGKGPQRG